MQILTGTSGFSYKEWKGSFYPEKIPDKEMLSYYSERLDTVEINNTFYRLPKRNVLEAWGEQVNDGFQFSIKASRRITHFKRLKEADEECSLLFKNVEALGDHLGVILFQLPPNLKKDTERLVKFMDILPANLKAAFEFRHESWMDDEIYALLNKKNCALVITESDEEPEAKFVETADWSYLRLRRTQYDTNDLEERMKKIKTSKWNQVFVFFKHEDEGTGPALAKQFATMTRNR